MMQVRSRIPGNFFIKELTRIVLNDWSTFSTAFKLQLAKESFNWRFPDRGKDGRPDKLRQVSLRITDMCNLRCHTCGQWGDNGYLRNKSLKELKQQEVPLETYKNLVDQAVAEGWSPMWYIWGGEPMMYPGLFDLLHYISARKMPITMVTNGTGKVRWRKNLRTDSAANPAPGLTRNRRWWMATHSFAYPAAARRRFWH